MSDEQEVRVERRIAAPPAAVYAYLTDAALWARWQGASASLDAVAGGSFVMWMPNDDVAEGTFVELVPDRRVVFTWGWRGNDAVPPGSSIVEIDLIADGEGTIIRLVHRGLPADAVGIHAIGWRHYLPRLAVVATGADPGPDSGPR